MKIKERLAFIKAGYTKEDIRAMEEAEKEPEQVPEEPEPEKAVDDPDYLKLINDEISSLKELINTRNIQDSGKDIPPEKTGADMIKDILKGE